MSNAFGSLSDDEVRQIILLVQNLGQSNLDFLQVELGDLKLTIGKGAPPAAGVAIPAHAPTAAAPAAAPVAAPAAAPIASAKKPAGDGAAQPGTMTITAPIMGRYYAQPEPGAPPFLSVGAEISEGGTIALIEVMKVFNAVPAGVTGIVTEICAQDSDMVEYGQVICRVRPS